MRSAGKTRTSFERDTAREEKEEGQRVARYRGPKYFESAQKQRDTTQARTKLSMTKKRVWKVREVRKGGKLKSNNCRVTPDGINERVLIASRNPPKKENASGEGCDS